MLGINCSWMGLTYEDMSGIYRSVLLVWLRRSFPSLWVKKKVLCEWSEKQEINSKKITLTTLELYKKLHSWQRDLRPCLHLSNFVVHCEKTRAVIPTAVYQKSKGEESFTWVNAGISYSIRSNMMFLGARECVSHAQPRPQTVFE